MEGETVAGGTSGNTKVISTDGINETTNQNDDDQFGQSVSLHGKWLAVGGNYIEGRTGSTASPNWREGAVFLYSYTDTAFSDGQLRAIIGDGYSGGNNINEPLDKRDLFGSNVSIFTDDNGNGRLAVNALGEDGFEDPNNTNNGVMKGAVYLYTFNDDVNAAAMDITRVSRIGAGATGTNEIDLSAGIQTGFDADQSTDKLGDISLSVGADGSTRLAVGVSASDGYNDAETDAGDVLLFTFNDAAGKDFSGGELAAVIGSGYNNTAYGDPATARTSI